MSIDPGHFYSLYSGSTNGLNPVLTSSSLILGKVTPSLALANKTLVPEAQAEYNLDNTDIAHFKSPDDLTPTAKKIVDTVGKCAFLQEICALKEDIYPSEEMAKDSLKISRLLKGEIEGGLANNLELNHTGENHLTIEKVPFSSEYFEIIFKDIESFEDQKKEFFNAFINIQNPEDKSRVIKKCIDVNCERVARDFELFDISDQHMITEVVEILAQKDPKNTALLFKNFPIKDEEARIQLAMICQQAIPLEEKIKNFNISNEQARVQLALADIKYSDISDKLDVYEIKNPIALLKVARSCIQQYYNSFNSLQWISTLGFDEKTMLKLYVFYLKYKPNSYPLIELKTPLYEKFRSWISKDPVNRPLKAEDLDKFYIALRDYIGDQQSIKEDSEKGEQLNQISNLLIKANQEKSLQVKHELLSWIAFTVITVNILDEPSSKLPLKDIFNLRDAEKRYQCLANLVDNVLDADKLHSYQEILLSKSKKASLEHMKLPALFLVELKEAKKFDDLITCLQTKRDLRDGPTLKLALHVLDAITKDQMLTADEKVKALLTAFQVENKEKMKENLFSLQTIYLLEKEEELQAANFEVHGENFDSIMKKMVKELPFQGHYENFESLYQQTFGSCRQSPAILVYAGILKKFSDIPIKKQAFSALSIYLDSVLDGSFKTKRYETSHLEQVFALEDSLKNRWMSGYESNFEEEKLKNLTLIDTDNYWDLLMCGTEIPGSCQNVSDTTELNIGLLAYLLDGKNRLIAIKNKEGKIVARSILRLLINRETNQPALIMEKIYSNYSKLDSALIHFAKQRAEALNLDLFTEGQEQVFLDSLGGSQAPLEYVDSMGGLKEEGIFSIKRGKLLQKANPSREFFSS